MGTWWLALCTLFLSLGAWGQNGPSLSKEFMNPPNSAKPRVWWHWMNGNITKHGIQKDLEWMDRIGIGGFQNFDANLFTPVVVEKKLEFMQPAWKDAFLFATKLADSLDLEMAIAGSPGWSVTGGPWVEPKDGMKKYVWTETHVQGGKPFKGALTKPSDVPGNFQNVEIPEEGLTGGFIGTQPSFYKDAAVVAYRLPEAEKTLSELNPGVSSSGGEFNLKNLTDGDLNTGTYLPPKEPGEDMWIQYEFDTPQTFKALSVVGAAHNSMEQFRGSTENRSLQVSDDGVNFRKVAPIHGSMVAQTTVSFPPTTAKYFRFVYETLPGQVNQFAAMMGAPAEAPKPEGVNVAEFVLYNTDRIDKVEDKAGFSPWKEDTPTYLSDTDDAVDMDNIVDLTSKMDAEGNLDWQVPPGNWSVIRFGYSLTGRQNHPASPEATGLEVDKLDTEAVRSYIHTYLDMYKDATSGMMGDKGLGYMILDSYEAGHMNWTRNFPQEFEKRRGYDMRPWIPVLIGRVVKSTENSEKFLWDFRKTIGEMIVENHYDVIGEELHKRDMKRYTESHEGGRIYLADGMDVKRNADIPMSAMWVPGSLAGGDDEEVRSEADIRESASVAHIYGKPFVAAESMTSIGNAFSLHPEKLKRTADLELASGLNRFVIHTSVHQPLDDKMPGFSLGPFGQYFTRQETWAEPAKAWIAYLTRSSYMLQQGDNVADVLYYYGENHNITEISKDSLPAVPQAYEFDYVNATALLNAIEVHDGKLVANSGNTYQLLALDESAKYMTLPVLKKFGQLVEAGAKVTGTKPEASPSLADDRRQFQALADKIWQNKNILTGTIEEALTRLGVAKDVEISNTDSEILFRHRRTPQADIYWLNNRSEKPTSATVSFRVSGKAPQLWNPQNGETREVSYHITNDRTIVPLEFDPWDAFFIVFGKNTNAESLTLPKIQEEVVATIEGPWKVSFEKERGAPATAQFDSLVSWTDYPDKGIKYFSGTATYKTTFDAPNINEHSELVLDLGAVKNLAQVFLNGKPLGTVWKKPFKVELDGVRQGENRLEIKITNVWVNRLIGDAQPGVKNKITFTTLPFYQKDDPLLPSGLMGPVKLVVRKRE